MKISKEELKQKIDELVTDDDAKITLLEDIEDSVDVINEEEKTDDMVSKADYDELLEKFEELKAKYKERFLKVEDIIEEIEEEKEEDIVEEETPDVIDVQDIFSEEIVENEEEKEDE